MSLILHKSPLTEHMTANTFFSTSVSQPSAVVSLLKKDVNAVPTAVNAAETCAKSTTR